MKIEKINDNQIRCTLTRADLAERQLKLSELAYGTEKVRSLFRDMMQQAANEFGFEAEDIPLMIEAIPVSSDSIVLIITKVEDPEELDTRFSKFSPSPQGDSQQQKSSVIEHLKKLEGADDFLKLLQHVRDSLSESAEKAKQESAQSGPMEETAKKNTVRLFSFATLDDVIRASLLLDEMYDGSNTLYKDDGEDIYVLVMSQSGHSSSDFHRICNMLTEYGSSEPSTGANLAFLEEHCDVILAQNAVQTLAQL